MKLLYIERVGRIAKDLNRKIHIAKAKVDSAKMVLAEKRDLWLHNKDIYSAFAPIIKYMERLKAKKNTYLFKEVKISF